MAGASGLAVILLGVFLGAVLVFGALGILVYALAAANVRRAYKASIVALILSIVTMPLFYPLWAVVLTGIGSHGDPIDYKDFRPVIFILSLESLAMAAAVWAVIKRKRQLGRLALQDSAKDHEPR